MLCLQKSAASFGHLGCQGSESGLRAVSGKRVVQVPGSSAQRFGHASTTHMAEDHNRALSRGPPPPPLLQAFCRGRLFQTVCRAFLAAMMKHMFPQGGVLFLGACRRTPPFVTNLCREMDAQHWPVANPIFLVRCLLLHMSIV